MKKFKRRISLLLMIMVMVLSMCVGVSADDATGTITLKNDKSATNVSIAGQEYSAYKVFDLKQNEDKTTFAYTLANEFEGLFTSDAFTTAFEDVGVDEEKTSTIYNFVSKLTAADVEKFADVVNDFATAEGIDATKTATAAATTDDENIETAVFEELALGYYFIYGEGTSVDNSSNVVTACVLDTTTVDTEGAYAIEIDVKVGIPTVDKVIVSDSDVKADAVSINDTVNFKVTSEVPNFIGYTSYTLTMTDTMAKGLSYKSDMVVKIGDDTIDAADYIVDSETDATTGITTITVTFNDFYKLAKDVYDQGTAITYTYSATLNADAVVGTDGNTNTAVITYSCDPYDTTKTNNTATSTVKVYTFKYNIFKYSVENGANVPLAGAEFELTKSDSTDKIAFVDLGNGQYRVATTTDATTVTTLVSADNGYIYIEGLGEGDYVLTETKAPEGYNLLEAPINVTIAPEYDATDATKYNNMTTPATDAEYTLLETNDGILSEVLNTYGTELPSTGGVGTTIFYIVGGLLIAFALIALTMKKMAKKA